MQLSLKVSYHILFNSKTIYRQQSWFLTNPRWKFQHPLFPFQEMETWLAWQFKQHQESPAKILLIGDSLISNLNRYPDVWNNSFSIHNTLNFGIQVVKMQNILWWLNNLNFSKHCSKKMFSSLVVQIMLTKIPKRKLPMVL